MYRMNVLCCAGTGCSASNSAQIVDNLNEALKKYDIDSEVKVVKTGCFGLCQKGPIVAVYPDKVFYYRFRTSLQGTCRTGSRNDR